MAGSERGEAIDSCMQSNWFMNPWFVITSNKYRTDREDLLLVTE